MDLMSWILALTITVIMLLAQAKLFSIDATLKEIRDEMKKATGQSLEPAEPPAAFTRLGL